MSIVGNIDIGSAQSNHSHLFLITNEANISRVLQWLPSYSTYYNLKHNRKEQLFEGRFKSIVVGADKGLPPPPPPAQSFRRKRGNGN